MKVYVVGDNGPEHNSIHSIHRTYKGAFKEWDKLRKELLASVKESLKRTDKFGKGMYSGMIKNLSCKDPKKIDNFPHETPYIIDYDLEE
jgi:hypothetical protein